MSFAQYLLFQKFILCFSVCIIKSLLLNRISKCLITRNHLILIFVTFYLGKLQYFFKINYYLFKYFTLNKCLWSSWGLQIFFFSYQVMFKTDWIVELQKHWLCSLANISRIHNGKQVAYYKTATSCHSLEICPMQTLLKYKE